MGTIIWRGILIAYAVGVALVVRDQYRQREAEENPLLDAEDQLDIAIHAREIEA